MDLKTRINYGLVECTRKYGLEPAYGFLNDEDYAELPLIRNIDISKTGYVIWSCIFLNSGTVDIDELIKSHYDFIPEVIKCEVMEINFVVIKKPLDLVEDQIIDSELYENPYVLIEDISFDHIEFKDVFELLGLFKHPFVEIYVYRKEHSNDMRIKFKGLYQYKNFIDKYRSFILNFIEDYDNSGFRK